MAPLCTVFVVGGVAMFLDGETWMGGLIAAFCSLGLAMPVMHLASRRVALRVGAEGVTLSLSPPWSERHTAVVPWSGIQRIVLWRQRAGHASIRYIGLEWRRDTPYLPGSASGKLSGMVRWVVPDKVPTQVAVDSRQINGWRLNRRQLEAAVAAFAPHVPIVDLD